MKIKLLLISILFSCFSWGQIISWDFTVNNNPNINLPAGATSLSFDTGGTDGVSGCTNNGFSTNSWNVNEYLQIVAPTTNYDISTLTFNLRSSNTGPLNFKVQYSSNGVAGVFNDFATTFASTNASTCAARSIDLSSINTLDNNANTVIRLVFTGGEADGSPASGDASMAGTFRIDDLILNGSSSVAAPNLAITGTPTNHGSVCTTTSGTTIQYTITNSGSVAASGITVVSNDPQFLVSGLSSTSISASGGTATYTVTFTPTSAGIKNAIITVASTTSGSNSPTNALTGTGVTAVAQSVTTSAATLVSSANATLNGSNILGVCPSTTVRGFVYAQTATTANPQVGGVGVTVNNSTLGASGFTANLSGLIPTTQYSFVAYVYDGTTYNYGTVLTLTTTILTSNSSDIVSVGTSESPTISSLINDNAPLTSATGVQVWQFKVRDGGVGLNDADAFPTILTDFTMLQNAGNTVGTWTDGINTIALFDGANFIATGTVTGTTIVFSGLNISVTDNTEKTLSLRLSLKCPLGADAFDGEDFVFSISNANVTFSPTGSTKSAFGAQISLNGSNVISVVATKLIFSSQPLSAGINAAMSNVVLTALDACNNKDLNFTGTVSLTSTGTMTGSLINIAAVAGVATFTNIIHTVIGSGLTLSASATGLTGITSSLFDILTVTTLTRGDLAIIAVNVNTGAINASSGTDEIVFVCFQDILIGTTFYITDNGYERKVAGKWGSTEGVISITRTGTTLPKGTIIVFRSNVNPGNVANISEFEIYSCGVVDGNWTKGIVPIFGRTGFNLNSNDDIWITQGGTWTDGATAQEVTYDGNVLYGWTESGWNAAPGGGSQSSQWSTLFPSTECYVTLAPTGNGFVKFNQPIAPGFATTLSRLDWISLINNTLNWTTYTDNTTYVAGGYNYYLPTPCLNISIIGDTYINGKWTGARNKNWFDCANWDTLVVPDATVDVQVGDNTFNNQAIISATAQFASDYGNIAKAKNLTITGEKVEIVGNINNKLEVNGNVLIDVPAGALDMDDSTAALDGQLTFNGNWTNNISNSAFEEGNGTVNFNGALPQIINNIASEGTEVFHNVILNNNFDTSVSNNLIATGNLTLATTKTLTIPSNNYVSINKVLTNNGTINVANNGSLVQTENGFLNSGSGTTNITRTTPNFDLYDYTYWSSPVKTANLASTFGNWYNSYTFNFNTANFSDLNSGLFNPTSQIIPGSDSFDDNGDDWVKVTSPAATNLTPGVGYTILGGISGAFPRTETVTFSGEVNNGIIPFTLVQSANAGSTTDDFNFVGNPYPSSIKADDFIKANITPLAANNNISGTLYFWTHIGNLSPVGTNPGPNINNYNSNDYATYNLSGATGVGSPSGSGSLTPDGFIGTGQGFFIEGETTNDLIFNNSMRNKTHTNNQFFRNSNSNLQKDRLWLNFENVDKMFSQQLIAYLPETTTQFDYGYDGLGNKSQNYVKFYSFMENNLNSVYKIQSRANFDTNDQVKLGYSSAVSGQTSISIDRFEGIFENQNIYLQDNLLNITHDLKQASYTFTTNFGTFNDRFVLKYINTVLANNTFVNAENAVNVYVKDSKINIQSNLLNIKQIEVFDILGRNLINSEEIENKTFTTTTILVKNQTLIVKIKLENGQIISKKILI